MGFVSASFRHQVNLDPTVGGEIKKSRPVVVLNPGQEKKLRLASRFMKKFGALSE